MEQTQVYDCRVYAILSEKENLGVPFARIVKGAPCAAMKGFYEGLKKDDYLGKTVQFAMNYGFDRSVKKILDELADVYKIAFDKNPKFTEAQKKYTDVKKEIERAGVLKCDFLFKDILLKHLTAAIEKTEVFADKATEMFVPGLDERMAESKEAFLKLKDALDGVFDWSSEAALERAKEIVYQIRIWNNVKIVNYMTSVNRAGRNEVLGPIEKAEEMATAWADATLGVGKSNPRVKKDQLRELEFQDDQLKVWMEIHKKRKTK